MSWWLRVLLLAAPVSRFVAPGAAREARGRPRRSLRRVPARGGGPDPYLPTPAGSQPSAARTSANWAASGHSGSGPQPLRSQGPVSLREGRGRRRAPASFARGRVGSPPGAVTVPGPGRTSRDRLLRQSRGPRAPASGLRRPARAPSFLRGMDGNCPPSAQASVDPAGGLPTGTAVPALWPGLRVLAGVGFGGGRNSTAKPPPSADGAEIFISIRTAFYSLKISSAVF